MWGVASAVDAPATAVRDAGELLHIDMHQLTGPIPLITDRWCLIGGTVTAIETAESFSDQDLLDGRAGPAHLMADVSRAPATLPAQLDDPPTTRLGCRVRGPMWS